MTLKEQIEKAIDKGTAVELALELQVWEETGQVLFGKLLDFEPFTSGDYETECQRYTFQTDEGRVSTILGSVGDRALASPANKGRLFRIMFNGKKTGKKGKSYNDFSILMIPEMVKQ